jgi:hypothetical protein
VDNIARALKVFVIAGGIVLLAGTVLLVVLIVLRPPENRQAATAASAPEAAAPAADPADRLCEAALPTTGFSGGPLDVPLPAGARIEQVVPAGGCLIFLGVDGAGRQFVALVDPLTGARLSLLLARPAP